MLRIGLGGVLASLLIGLSWVDLRTSTLPNALNLALLVAGAVQVALIGTPSPRDAFIGVLVGGSAFVCIALLYKSYRQIEGLGMGDAKFLAAAGAWVGWRGLPELVFIASLAALLCVTGQAIQYRRLSLQKAIAFGPFLSLALFLVWLFPIELFYE